MQPLGLCVAVRLSFKYQNTQPYFQVRRHSVCRSTEIKASILNVSKGRIKDLLLQLWSTNRHRRKEWKSWAKYRWIKQANTWGVIVETHWKHRRFDQKYQQKVDLVRLSIFFHLKFLKQCFKNRIQYFLGLQMKLFASTWTKWHPFQI